MLRRSASTHVKNSSGRAWLPAVAGLCCALLAHAASISVQPPVQMDGYYAIPIAFQNNGSADVSGMQFDVQFNGADFDVVDVAPGSAATTSSKAPLASKPSGGKVRVVVAGMNQTAIRNGTLAYVLVQPRKNEADPADIQVQGVVFSDPSGNPVMPDGDPAAKSPPSDQTTSSSAPAAASQSQSAPSTTAASNAPPATGSTQDGTAGSASPATVSGGSGLTAGMLLGDLTAGETDGKPEPRPARPAQLPFSQAKTGAAASSAETFGSRSAQRQGRVSLARILPAEPRRTNGNTPSTSQRISTEGFGNEALSEQGPSGGSVGNIRQSHQYTNRSGQSNRPAANQATNGPSQLGSGAPYKQWLPWIGGLTIIAFMMIVRRRLVK